MIRWHNIFKHELFSSTSFLASAPLAVVKGSPSFPTTVTGLGPYLQRKKRRAADFHAGLRRGRLGSEGRAPGQKLPTRLVSSHQSPEDGPPKNSFSEFPPLKGRSMLEFAGGRFSVWWLPVVSCFPWFPASGGLLGLFGFGLPICYVFGFL